LSAEQLAELHRKIAQDEKKNLVLKKYMAAGD
jgi:hypothetical protein